MTGVVVAIAAGLTPIGTLGTLVSIGTLMAFVIVSIGDHRPAPDAAGPAAAVPDAVGAACCRSLSAAGQPAS